MAIRVPVAQRQVSQQVGNIPTARVPEPVRGAYGEDLARSGQSIAKGIGDVADVFKQRNEERKKLENKKQLNLREMQFKNDIRNAMFSEDEEEFSYNGKTETRKKGIMLRNMYQADGSSSEFQNWYEQNRDRYLDGILDKETRVNLSILMDSYYNSRMDDVVGHEVKQASADRLNTAEAKKSQEKDILFTSSKPNDIKSSLVRIAELQDEVNAEKGLIGEAGEVAKKKAVDDAASSVIEGALLRDRTGVEARTILAGMKENISNEAYGTLEVAIDSQVKKNASLLIDELNEKALNGELTPEEVLLYSTPKTIGGVGGSQAKVLMVYLDNQQKEKLGIYKTINKAEKKRIEKYTNLIDAAFSDSIDRYQMKQLLIENYADSVLDDKEKKEINRVSDVLRDLKDTKQGTWFRWNKSFKELMRYAEHNDIKDERATKILQSLIVDVLQNQNKTEEEVKESVDNIKRNDQIEQNPAVAQYNDGQEITRAGRTFIVNFVDGKPTFIPKK